MRSIFLLVSLLLVPTFFSSQGWAQPLAGLSGTYSYHGIQSGWNSRIGESLEVVFKVEAMPEGGLLSEAAMADVISLCGTIAKTKLNQYIRVHGNDPPKYYSISIQTGKQAGIYGRLYFRVEGECKPVRLSTLN